MVRRVSKDFYKRKLFQGTFIGPVKVMLPASKKAMFQAFCHLCSYIYYEKTAERARDILLWHLDDTHFKLPPDRVGELGVPVKST